MKFTELFHFTDNNHKMNSHAVLHCFDVYAKEIHTFTICYEH